MRKQLEDSALLQVLLYDRKHGRVVEAQSQRDLLFLARVHQVLVYDVYFQIWYQVL